MTAVTLHLGAYLPRSWANGPGLRAVLWVQGCPLRCPGCFNPDLWPFTGGWTEDPIDLAEQLLADPDTEGVSLSGGEPFAQAAALAPLGERLRAAGKGVLVFTGLATPALHASTRPGVRRLLAAADLLVAGPYQRERTCRHPLLASANQELVFLSERYRGLALGPRRSEYRIGPGGAVTVTGFPSRPEPPEAV
jgi:anaerobic ribonucleoside-triphosphate reductase activating protein